jgi:CO dehydrogenase maturation factor
MIIAVSGKGGTGKTVVSTLLVRLLKDSGDLLAIDADPDSNLPETLGTPVEKTLGDVREEILEERDKLAPEQSWASLLEYKIQGALEETDDYDLLVMGRPEGPGCYCAVNNVLRNIIDVLARNYDHVVIDTEAGLEHLSRRTTQDVDIMLVVTDSSRRGLDTAKRIVELAHHLKIKFKDIFVVLNRTSPENEANLKETAKEMALEVIGVVPEDEGVRALDTEGRPLTELPEESGAFKAVKDITEKLMRKEYGAVEA